MRYVQVVVLRVRGFETPPLLPCIRYGVVGNMSGSHPVASGSIPGIGYAGFAGGRGIDTPKLHSMGALAQMVERPLSISFGVISQR